MRSLPLALALVGCAVAESDATSDSEPIIGGQIAREYSSAVLVDSDRGYCSGALIAPSVVLIAGHCVKGATKWTVTAPFAPKVDGTTPVSKSTKSWTKYTAASGIVNPRAIDVAVLTLDTPIAIPAYPSVVGDEQRPGTKVRNVGRVRNGVVSRDVLFIGRQVTLERGLPSGYPNSYLADQVAESGDSGGPVFDDQGRIVAVNSGGANGVEVLGRVDLVADDIALFLEPKSGLEPSNDTR